MIVYTTCRDCGGLLHTTDGDTVHPNCTPKPTKAKRLAQQWLTAVEANDEAREAQLFPLITEIDSRPPRFVDAALRYAQWGWLVFPLKPRTKQPATRNGFKDATTDADQIRAWWDERPDSNIGLPTGHAFDVIDIDVPDGIPTYQQLLTEDRVIHGHVVTASGGSHLYIKPTGRGCAARWKPGADFRGVGGYVVAPPSWLGEHGRAWSWLHYPSPLLTGAGDTYGVQ